MTNHPVSKKAGLSQSKVTEGAMQASTRVVQQAAAVPMLGAARVGRGPRLESVQGGWRQATARHRRHRLRGATSAAVLGPDT